MSEPSITFRQATAEDGPIILSMIRSAYRGDAGGVNWTTELQYVDHQRITLGELTARITKGANGMMLVAERHEPTVSAVGSANPKQVVACCEVSRQPGGSTCEFGLFAVDPMLQGSGLGKLMLAEAERVAKEVFRCEKMLMLVISLRAELIAWYARRGYVLLETTTPFDPAWLVDGKMLTEDLAMANMEKVL